ncbi:MAG: response regulator transcription factor [Candidatus Thiodiazotropha sp.]
MNSKQRILIIEDETAIRTGLIDVFVYHGYEVDSAGEGPEGLHKALSGRFDMILLDVMLPGIDGFEICQKIREQDPAQPVIMLTAKTRDEDIIQGLTLGADDYVAKPFSVAQLVLRVQAVLRRTGGSPPQQTHIRLGERTSIDTLNLAGETLQGSCRFTRREMQILQYLDQHRERPVPREELLHKVWGYAKNLDLETRTVDIHIAKLRRKIEPDSNQPRFLVTVRGAGYRLLSG